LSCVSQTQQVKIRPNLNLAYRLGNLPAATTDLAYGLCDLSCATSSDLSYGLCDLASCAANLSYGLCDLASSEPAANLSYWLCDLSAA
jgi:hypothetical protein